VLEGLLKDCLVHSTKNVDTFVFEGTATEEIPRFLHFGSLFPCNFLMLRWIFQANVVESISADLNRFKPLVGISVITTNDIDIFVSNINSSMSHTSNVELRMFIQGVHAFINLINFIGRAVPFCTTD